jgi:hypothetical protein
LPFCMNCGEEIPEDAVFCEYCGANQRDLTKRSTTAGKKDEKRLKPSHDVRRIETPSSVGFRKIGTKLLSILIIIIIVAAFVFVVITDLDSDGFNGYTEIFTYRTNPFFSDSDWDGLPDKWEINYGFDPISPHDASKDPDFDGLTNLQEYRLGTVLREGALSYQKDLFVEIDYMPGYEPSTTVMDYFVSYYRELNIEVHIEVDDETSWDQLSAIGVSPDSLTPYECYLIEQSYHDHPNTDIYVFYAKKLRDPDESEPLGWAGEFGAFISKEKVNSNEGLSVLWLTDRVRTERVVLLHEVGHVVGVLKLDSNGEEDYCSRLGCIMAGADRWWDIAGGISQVVVLWSYTPRYCDEHASMINLQNKWSVNESWSP